ncbi:MAG: lipid II:glycine glycyltransferase FemX [Microgenomates group bacterium]
MLVREVLPEEKEKFNQVVNHPLQSWEWGEFRKKTGIEVIRLGVFDPELVAGWQLTVHPLPKIPSTIIYFPKGPLPDKLMLESLRKIGQQKKAVFVKLEPNVGNVYHRGISAKNEIEEFLLTNGCQVGRPLFTRFTFHLDLTKSEEEILGRMKPKTRYNIRLAQRHGVEVVEDNSQKAFEIYLKLLLETTRRQHFYAHSPQYHRLLWETLAPTDIYHLFLAKYKGLVLAAYIFFTFNKVLYYPYGASTRVHKEVMAPYALFWEAIKFGKQKGCKIFDMWGTPGPNPDPKDPWFGFHRFKEGFGGELVEFIGSYDLVLNRFAYSLFTFGDTLRWKFLRFLSRFRR